MGRVILRPVGGRALWANLWIGGGNPLTKKKEGRQVPAFVGVSVFGGG
jgi:hypothetical protein